MSTLRHIPHSMKPQPGDVVLKYKCLHVPTGKTFERVCGFISRTHMLELLDVWNGQQPATWHYWSTP